ncbi:endospore coat-associated protein [Paenibacillus swuensis]|uniref:Endospore coat-associated protein n=1 Tax=Paenibacillus swuensis TaxID=1178515 RepID=A0A172TPV2_9BACL|nr:endospore coat-associated protein [Paenibacillus swuensis]
MHLHDVSHKPVLAILTVDDDNGLFRGNRNNFIDLIKTGRDLGFLVYVATCKELKLNNKRIIGFTYNAESKTWLQQLFPLPHVVYNRIPFRKDELLPESQRAIDSCLRHPNIRIFNPAFFNKWHLFEWLKKSKSTRKYIPATRKLTTAAEFGKLLKQHTVLYLKPERGKAGVGIMRAKQTTNKEHPFRLTVQDEKGSHTYRFTTLSKLWSKLSRFTGDEDYIAQQGIQLASVSQRPFDLRLLVQKNYKGQWDVTGIGARVAGVLSITTHVPRGGSIDDPEKLLTVSFGSEIAKKLMVKAKHAAHLIARQVEKGAGHSLGEMSMDMGVDEKGNIWFFEANAKPMKFDEPHIRKKSLERIFQYSMHLSKHWQVKSGGG